MCPAFDWWNTITKTALVAQRSLLNLELHALCCVNAKVFDLSAIKDQAKLIALQNSPRYE